MQKFFFAGQPGHRTHQHVINICSRLRVVALKTLTLVARRTARLTFRGAVVGDEAGHVNGLAVDPEVSHAAHEVSVSDREVLR